MKKPIKITIIVLSVILALLLAALVAVLILSKIGESQFHKNDTDIQNASVTAVENGIIYNDERYTLNPNIVSFLLIGIDKEGTAASPVSGINGQADTLLVVAVDTETKAINIIPISRETLVDINRFDMHGNYVGVSKEQICLAYAYGKNVTEGSENVLLSVSRLLYGININSYIAMDLDALEKISNEVGSIEVYVNESYLDTDSGNYYKKGQTIKVKGKSAVFYIHWRTDDVNANTYRMERQKSFMTAFINKVSASVSQDFSKVVSYYNLMKPYVTTNISLPQTTYLATNCLKLNLGDSMTFRTIPGETFIRDGFSAFTPDEDALTAMIIDVFYNKVS